MRKIILTAGIVFIHVLGFAQQKGANNAMNCRQHEIRIGLGDPFLGFMNSTETNIFPCPSLSVEYHFRPLTWLWVGGGISFNGAISLTNLSQSSLQVVSPFVSTRFSYFNREHVFLYSGFSASLFSFGYNLKRIFYSNITLFGVSAGGKHWFGSAELGLGYKGFINIGFGYRFQ